MCRCLPTLTALLIAAPAFAGEPSSCGDPASKCASEAPKLERFMPEQQVSKGHGGGIARNNFVRDERNTRHAPGGQQQAECKLPQSLHDLR